MEILLQVILILVNAFFAGTEMAVVSLNATKLRKMQEEGDKIAGKLLSMVEDSSAFLSTIQVAITLAGYLGAAFAGDAFAPQRDVVRRVVNDPENNWNRLLCSLWTDIDSEVLKKIFTNFLLNANFIGWERQEKAREKYNCNIPWAILMDPPPPATCTARAAGRPSTATS